MPSKNHYVSFKALGYPGKLEDSQQHGNEELLTRISNHPFKKIKRGDTISLQRSNHKYRNDWTYMWDGTKAVELETEYDEYGHVPKQFVVGKEFQPDHWKNTIQHNTIFHLSNEITAWMNFEESDEGFFWYADVDIGGVKWRCYTQTMDDFDIEDCYFSLDEGELEGQIEDTERKLFFAYMPIEH